MHVRSSFAMPNEDIAATRAVPLGYDFDLSPFTQSECSTVRTHWPCRGVEVSSLTLFFQCYPFVSIQREHYAASTALDPSTEPGHGDALASLYGLLRYWRRPCAVSPDYRRRRCAGVRPQGNVSVATLLRCCCFALLCSRGIYHDRSLTQNFVGFVGSQGREWSLTCSRSEHEQCVSNCLSFR